ncbi:hypothetical protein Nepgr_000523 [Nepenthes gracilis]|uniref:Autophagy-related protein n=1 Tax=Nepenthes gracilis TaxID=150966 RepID=A0AAD3RWA1_NEPGR|nr:hypothetical protein Nepgr_000523 [Nepenthes gracilis]
MHFVWFYLHSLASQFWVENRSSLPSYILFDFEISFGLSDMAKRSFKLEHPRDLTVGQFVYVVRKRIKLSPEKAIFIFVKNFLPPSAAMMSAIYEENKEDDGFLYMTYSGENTFGTFEIKLQDDLYIISMEPKKKMTRSRLFFFSVSLLL